jgi:dTMP kinase
MKQFITFEGIDGSGKTTVMHNVYATLQKRGYNVIKTNEPTETELGRCVQYCIKTNKEPVVTAFTFISDRILHGKQIKQWLNEGCIVLCDRYADSTYAYQGTQLQDKMQDPIKWLQELSVNRFPIPDRTFLFDIDPHLAVQRIQNRDELIAFEKVSFLEKVQKNYHDISKGKQYKIIDATQSVEKISQIIIDDIIEVT